MNFSIDGWQAQQHLGHYKFALTGSSQAEEEEEKGMCAEESYLTCKIQNCYSRCHRRGFLESLAVVFWFMFPNYKENEAFIEVHGALLWVNTAVFSAATRSSSSEAPPRDVLTHKEFSEK